MPQVRFELEPYAAGKIHHVASLTGFRSGVLYANLLYTVINALSVEDLKLVVTADNFAAAVRFLYAGLYKWSKAG